MSNPKTVKVSNTDDLSLALAAGYTPDQIVIDNTAAIAAAREEGIKEGKASAVPDLPAIKAEVAKAERERIAAIDSLCRAGFEAERKAAIETGATPEAFALTVLRAAQDRGITLEAIKRDSPTAAPHAKPAEKDAGPTGIKSWDDVQAGATKPNRM